MEDNTNSTKRLENLVDLICLLYHEARNVRHPIKAGKIQSKSNYNKLISLPNNRYEAWQHMAKVRTKAIATQKPINVLHVFQQEYGLSLEDLLVLYRASCWKGSKYGGNKWAPICSKVCDLIKVLNSADDCISAQLFEKIPQMEHNTGRVRQKLLDLKKSLDF